MRLQDYTIESGFLPQIKCSTLDAVIEAIVRGVTVDCDPCDVQALTQEVLRREQEVSTAIGGGLMVPHARFRGLDHVRIGVATLIDPLHLPAEDDRPVDVVILLVGPDADPRQMLRVLARLARQVRTESFLNSLRSANTSDELRAAFAQVDATP